jgi:hypothetical protein
MKKLYFSALFICISLLSFGQIVNIPDANFKAKLIANGVDTNNDSEIQISEAQVTTVLDLRFSSISSLEGIQYFSTLNYIDCSNNLLTDLNICGTAVYFVICDNNPNLTTISIKNNVVSMLLFGDPILNPLVFFNLPSLQSICYDEGELEAIQFGLDTQNISLSTSCNANCNSLNIQNQNEHVSIILAPNPVDGMLNIVANVTTKIESIVVYNVLGQLVKTLTAYEINASLAIDVSALKTGTYFMEISSNKGKTTKKFVKL